ncbi:MAG: hypothetical protein IJN75_02025 [Clostridia bacterium]|nr:hypothetical protein [Clostridia bacterium]
MKRILKIISIVILAFVILFALIFVFGTAPIHYDQMKMGYTYIENNGVIEFEYYLTDKVAYKGGRSRPIVYDYDNDVKYYYRYITISAKRWDVWFNSCKHTDPYFRLDKSGREIGRGIDESYTKEEYLENPNLLPSRCLGVYYLNPDGTFVLVWEHPDAEEIIERTGTELLPLNEYITPRRGR